MLGVPYGSLGRSARSLRGDAVDRVANGLALSNGVSGDRTASDAGYAGCSLAQLASHVGRRCSSRAEGSRGEAVGGVDAERSVNGMPRGENVGRCPTAGVVPEGAWRDRFGFRRKAESPTEPRTPSTSSFHWCSSERNCSASSLVRLARRVRVGELPPASATAAPSELRLTLRRLSPAAVTVEADPSRGRPDPFGERVESTDGRDRGGVDGPEEGKGE